jgi:hypothetical protein
VLFDGIVSIRVAQDRADVGPDEPRLALGVLDGPDRLALEGQLKGLALWLGTVDLVADDW